MKSHTIYIAGPLFSIAEQEFNVRLEHFLKAHLPNVNIILPQIYAKTISGSKDFVPKVFSYCLEKIHESDIVVAILDGADADSGTCIELGYAYALNKYIIGVRTDFRNSEDQGVNLMVSKVCADYIWDFELNTEALAIR